MQYRNDIFTLSQNKLFCINYTNKQRKPLSCLNHIGIIITIKFVVTTKNKKKTWKSAKTSTCCLVYITFIAYSSFLSYFSLLFIKTDR